MKYSTRVIVIVIFGAYILLMLWLLFGQRLEYYDIPGTYWEKVQYSLNLIPGATINDFIAVLSGVDNPYLVRHAVINLAGNIVMFIPLGFFLPCLWVRLRSFGQVLLAIVGIIVIIELIQLFTLLGSCDIDDLLLNTIGAVIGWLLWRAGHYLSHRFRLQQQQKD